MADPSLESTVRISDDVAFRELDGEAVLLNLETGIYFGLDAVGTRIWQLIAQYGALTAVLDAIVHEFEVPRFEAAADLLDLVRQLDARGLVRVQP